ncbi:aspartate aminotransferase family protein, partial [bacterium]
GVNAIEDLNVLGEPHATVFAIGSDTLNVYALSDALGERGWLLEKQHMPACLHVTVSPYHAEVADEFLKTLAEATDEIRGIDASNISQEAAMYGMMATMPDRKLARELAVQYLNDLYKLE